MRIGQTEKLIAHLSGLGFDVAMAKPDGSLSLHKGDVAAAEAARDAWVAAGNDVETVAERRLAEYAKIPLSEYLEALMEAAAEGRPEKLAALQAKRAAIKAAIK